MDNYYWMYWESSDWLYWKDFFKGVKGFVNFILSKNSNFVLSNQKISY
jgi:hypothetical protein